MDLTNRFIQGLLNYNLTVEEIQNGKWRYCGGNKKSHYRYFNIFFKNKVKLPEYEPNCVCGQYIVENCYITNGDKIMVLGNCCIKKFLPKNLSGRTCRVCKKPHKNQKDNLCHECREKTETRYTYMIKTLQKHIRPALLWDKIMKKKTSMKYSHMIKTLQKHISPALLWDKIMKKKTSMKYSHMIKTLQKHISPALLWDKIMDVEYVYEEVDFNISRTYSSTILSEIITTFPPNLTLDEIVIKAIEYEANIIVKNDIHVWELRYVDFPYEMIEKILINNEKRQKHVKSKTFLYKIID